MSAHHSACFHLFCRDARMSVYGLCWYSLIYMFFKIYLYWKTSFPKLVLLNITKTRYVWLICKITK